MITCFGTSYAVQGLDSEVSSERREGLGEMDHISRDGNDAPSPDDGPHGKSNTGSRLR